MTNEELAKAVELVKDLRRSVERFSKDTYISGVNISVREAELLFKAVDQVEAAVEDYNKENA